MPHRPYSQMPEGSVATFQYPSTAKLAPDGISSTTVLTPTILPVADDYAFFRTTKFKIAFVAMCIAIALFALDQFIITVAVPQIVSQFDSLDKVQWLNTAFFIPCAGTILLYTQIMTIASPRWVYMTAIVIFMIGCAICGAAQSMKMLIIGRAVAGLGGAGMWNAVYLIAGTLIAFEKRASYFGLFGVSYIFASVMGPLMGGALTDSGTSGWRWCFFITLPIGVIVLVLLFFTLPSIPKLPPFDGRSADRPVLVKLIGLDWVSFVLVIGFVTCLGMGLQSGGIKKEWGDTAVLVTLFLAVVLFAGLLIWNSFYGSRAMIPMSLLKRRHFHAGIWVGFLGYGTVVVYLYYLPLYFEAVKAETATRAGVLLLGLQLTMGPWLVVCGKIAERTGHARVFILLGSCFVTTASGLLTMINKSSPIAMLIGFEAIAGFGLGMILNIMVVLVQADYLKEPKLVPHVTGVFNFWGFVGRIVCMSSATSMFENKLRQGLQGISDLDPALMAAVAGSPEAIWADVPAEVRDSVLDIYSSSLDKVWWLALALGVATLVAGLLMRNINLKELGMLAARARAEATIPTIPMRGQARRADSRRYELQPNLKGWDR